MMTERAAASYRRDLGDGLVLRWSSADDDDGVALLMGTVWRDNADEPPNPRMMEAARRHLRGDYPLLGPGDTALVEATTLPGRPIVASHRCGAKTGHTRAFRCASAGPRTSPPTPHTATAAWHVP